MTTDIQSLIRKNLNRSCECDKITSGTALVLKYMYYWLYLFVSVCVCVIPCRGSWELIWGEERSVSTFTFRTGLYKGNTHTHRLTHTVQVRGHMTSLIDDRKCNVTCSWGAESSSPAADCWIYWLSLHRLRYRVH